MPPKSANRKSNASASWFHCEVCESHITSKAHDTHEQVCHAVANDALKEDNNPLEYIRAGKLYTASVERLSLNIEELQDLPHKYVNNLIFLSEGAIRLTELHIGQQVVVAAAGVPEKIIRTIWPIPENFLTTVFVTDTDLNLYWTPFKGKLVNITALTDHAVCSAKTVYLKLIDKQEYQLEAAQLKDVSRILKQEVKDFIFCTKSLLHLNFFNKPLKFIVNDWQSLNDTLHNEKDSLEDSLKNLSLNSKPEFFKIINGTQLELKLSESVTIDNEDPKYLVTKSNIGGLDKQIQLIEESMEYALGYKKLSQGVKISRGLLLFGATGCGKTMLCEAMCALAATHPEHRTQIIKMNSSELYSKFLGETEKNLTAYFDKAYAHYPQPTLMLLEDVHNLCPKHETSEVVKRVSAAFLNMLDQLSTKREAQRVFLLATTSQIEALHPSARRCGRLDSEIEISAPTPQGRIAIINSLLIGVPHELTIEDITQIAQVTHGFVGADLANLVYSASLAALKANDRKLNLNDLNRALTKVKPSAMREVLIESPNVFWSDIGGQSELKLKLQQAIEWPLLHPEKFKRLGIKPPRGILMFGPPGCSKTLIAKALATESKLNFLSIKGPELFSMWVGESERAVREVFRKARQVAPAIVFFDEIDAIGGERAEGGNGGSSGASVKERVLTQLLTELDGVETLQNVTIVAATNRPDMIDKALLRPGRIDRIVYVGLPDASARREILHIKLRSMPLADDVDVETLVTRTDGYSGAEIQAVCHEAALKTLEQSFDAAHVAWEHFEYALNAVMPRTSPELLKLYEEYLKRS